MHYPPRGFVTVKRITVLEVFGIIPGTVDTQ